MLNEDDNQVQIVSDDGHKEQWFKGRFYRKEGHKLVFEAKVTKNLIIGLLGVLCIGILFKDDPKQIKKIVKLSVPNRISSYQEDITLKVYSDTEKSKIKRVKRKKRKIERLSLVSSSQKVEIPLGAQVRAKLVTGGTNGPVKVRLLEDLESHGEIYIKEGSVLWGRGSSTDERLLINFTKYVDENGESKEIIANAFDTSDQILGLKGSVIGRTSKKIIAGAGLGVAGALQTMQQTDNLGGAVVTRPSVSNALLNGASGAAIGIAEQELEELKNKQTIIEVKKGTEILIVFGGM